LNWCGGGRADVDDFARCKACDRNRIRVGGFVRLHGDLGVMLSRRLSEHPASARSSCLDQGCSLPLPPSPFTLRSASRRNDGRHRMKSLAVRHFVRRRGRSTARIREPSYFSSALVRSVLQSGTHYAWPSGAAEDAPTCSRSASSPPRGRQTCPCSSWFHKPRVIEWGLRIKLF
jgi:hypothetical protein